ncbi:hypothetical protein B296_00035210 [Ensete ventricosum]|uniref:Exostosin GT47 domain-containing protein n=1 Tax=Ensete ventricosum TaxID=4639 RepID=A0A426YND2_ENSVE|nr:hypothetical protein B296_00035210 [Ensete ventricosum]
MGYEVNSPRIVEAIYYECVPVVIADNFVLPFEEVLDWHAFSVVIAEKDIANLKDILLRIPQSEYVTMQMNVKKLQKHFLWHAKPVNTSNDGQRTSYRGQVKFISGRCPCKFVLLTIYYASTSVLLAVAAILMFSQSAVILTNCSVRNHFLVGQGGPTSIHRYHHLPLMRFGKS